MKDPHLTNAYRRQLARHRLAGETVTRRAWDSLSSYDEADVSTFTARSAPLGAIRLRTAHLTAGYLARVTMTPIIAITAAQIVLPDEWFRQPFMSTWAALAAGHPFIEAVASGLSRAEQTGADAVTEASRSAATVVDQRTDAITGWERVPDGNACAWCLEVAGQTYTTADSADFGHDRCGCDVIPA